MPGTAADLVQLDATAQAELVRRRAVAPIELVDAAIARIEALNPQLNAVVTDLFESARDAAARPLPDGPFRGVPFLLKDLLAAYAGVRMTSGSRYLAGFVPTHDSELVARHKRAGLIIIGKTNTPEFGILPTTEPRLFGATRNPWDLSRSPGGSSGGSAAAVAAGMVPMAHGNDGGGSIRIPASCCGVFGLKPTRARNPLGPDVGDVMSGLVAEHALTRSVRDSAGLLDATAGPDVGDPYWAPPRARPFAQEVGAPPGRLHIAVSTAGPPGVRVHPDCVRATRDAATLCTELGHEVVEAAPAIDAERLTKAFLAVFTAGVAEAVESTTHLTGKKLARRDAESVTWAIVKQGRRVSATTYLLAVAALQEIARDVARFFIDYDLWLTPTLAQPPVPLGSFEPVLGIPLLALKRAAEFVAFTPICNVTGQPAMSVPLFWNDDGLPIGVHFAARFGDEATLFRLAAQLEAARPWMDRRPRL